ncbi:hypothetical protein HCH44_18305 [Sphingomonas melonis]|nr:hypothetical protein [Sphingomonas melonis]MBX8855959.1 hypothetical protein [Sphingomonas melonis]MBX8900847.1 hypothetical protein [Sphingomonas melonis]
MSRPPVVAAWGAGVDSTAMIVEMAERGEPIDMVLFADPGSEKAGTYAFLPIFRAWMAHRGIPSEICRYHPRNFKHWPPYATIAENMLTNATLPSVVFNRGSCSQKWKASAQDAWTADWEPARRCWDAGNRVVKLIGYDASARDTQRYHHALGCEDPRYAYRYPLREWGWDRARCERRIAAAGLPVPPKSSCFFCGSIKPDEVEELSADELRIIVLMEARAKPRLRNVDGLWRRPVLGRRGATPRPGSITEFIRERGLLPPEEIDRIIARAPTELLAFQAAQAALPADARTPMGRWLDDFNRGADALRHKKAHDLANAMSTP